MSLPYWMHRIHGTRATGFDAHVLSLVDLRSERMAAIARFTVILIIAIIVLGSVSPGLDGAGYLEGFLAANIVVSLLGIIVTNVSRWNDRLTWAAAILDVLILLGAVIMTDRQQAGLPECYVTARIAVWGIFLVFGLAVLRARPALLAMQTVLFTAGLIAFGHQDATLSLIMPELPSGLEPTCGHSQHAVRVSVVLLTGSMLAIASLRSRLTLRAAIASNRKASRLSRYLSPRVASVVVDTEVEALRDGRHQNVAVLFADLRGFTAMAESLPPREIAAFLAHFRKLSAEAIEAQGGVIDKFIGDEVMGLFGVPSAGSRDAERALRAATHLVESVGRWSDERVARGLCEVRVGVGIHYGPAFVGVLGHDRLEFTVLGNTVNTARRLEQMTKVLGRNCIASAWIVRAADAKVDEGWTARGLGLHELRGQVEPVAVYAIGRRRAQVAD